MLKLDLVDPFNHDLVHLQHGPPEVQVSTPSQKSKLSEIQVVRLTDESQIVLVPKSDRSHARLTSVSGPSFSIYASSNVEEAGNLHGN